MTSKLCTQAPAWLYEATVGVTPLIVNWKPSTACVPPLCVPVGTYDCALQNGQGCGCDGVYPCNQTFPDFLSPVYNKHLQEWIQATRDHVVGLPTELSSRILSVQVNVGSTGDGCFWHGSLYPAQREAGYQEMQDNATIKGDYFLRIKKLYIDIYSQGLNEDGGWVHHVWGPKMAPKFGAFSSSLNLALSPGIHWYSNHFGVRFPP